jgi:hypothetical protein
MISNRKIDLKIKTGSSWVFLSEVSVTFRVAYKTKFSNSEKDEIYSIEIRKLNIPSWADCYKNRIISFFKSKPEELYSVQNGTVLYIE